MTADGNSTRPVKYAHGKHPNTLNSLKPFQYKPGENGHQFRGYNFRERLKHALLKDPKRAEEFIQSTIAGAILREPKSQDIVWDRVDPVTKDAPPVAPGSQVLNIIVVGGQDNLKDILAQVKERTKQLAIGDGEG